VIKSLFILNTLLTFPFGVLALAMPATLFVQFGLQLDAAGKLIARGHGATLVAYGVILYLMRQSVDLALSDLSCYRWRCSIRSKRSSKVAQACKALRQR
jgi:hypothetical protein